MVSPKEEVEIRILVKLTLIVRKMGKQTVAVLNFIFVEQAQTIVQKVLCH